jgi:hypothetical protein
MKLTPAQQARNELGGATVAKQPPDVLAQRRASMMYLRAERAIAPFTALPLTDRARLAAKLLAGDDATGT